MRGAEKGKNKGRTHGTVLLVKHLVEGADIGMAKAAHDFDLAGQLLGARLFVVRVSCGPMVDHFDGAGFASLALQCLHNSCERALAKLADKVVLGVHAFLWTSASDETEKEA